MACLTLTVFLCVLLHPPWQARAFSWTSTVREASLLEGCEGESVTFPWSARLTTEERLEQTRYYRVLTREPVNNTDLQRYGDGELIATTDPRFRFHAKNFSLHINRATVNDSGIYTLVLRITKGNEAQDHKSKIILSVRARPRTDGRGLRLEVEPKAVKVTNGSSVDFHVGLSCGPFLDRGQPPVTVKWKTPTGRALSSTSFHDGHFLLVLSKHAEVGEYTCQVNPASPALQCAGTNDLVRIVATGSLSRADSRVIVLDAEKDKLQDELQSTVNRLQNELQKVRLELSPENCLEVNQYTAENGVRTLNIHGSHVSAYCDQVTDGGGWTVIQRRQNGAVNFSRGWDDYVSGFGDPGSQYWLGLRNIHRLTSSGVQYSLRIDLGDWDGSKAYALYDTFSVSGPEDFYRLHVASYSGTAGNSFMATTRVNYQNNQPFSTPDRDHDQWSGNCAAVTKSGWWFNNCGLSNLNGQYGTAQTRHWRYVTWYYGQYDWRSYKTTEMKIRPRQ